MLFDNFEKQIKPGYCPNCNKQLKNEEIVGFGQSKKQFTFEESLAVGYECKECFCKSACHCSEEFKIINWNV